MKPVALLLIPIKTLMDTILVSTFVVTTYVVMFNVYLKWLVFRGVNGCIV